jgi:hypothetical protein
MGKSFTFLGGAAVGFVALPASIVYIKSFRTKFANGFASFVSKRIRENPEARKEALQYAHTFIALTEKLSVSDDTVRVSGVNEGSALVYLKDAEKARETFVALGKTLENHYNAEIIQGELEFLNDLISQIDQQSK